MYKWSLDQWLHEHTYIIFYAGRLWYLLGDVDPVLIKGAVSRNSAKLGITKRPLNPRET